MVSARPIPRQTDYQGVILVYRSACKVTCLADKRGKDQDDSISCPTITPSGETIPRNWGSVSSAELLKGDRVWQTIIAKRYSNQIFPNT